MLQSIIYDIKQISLSYMQLAMISGVVVSVINMIFYWKETHTLMWGLILMRFLFWTYIVTVLELTLVSREPGVFCKYDLYPFETWNRTLSEKKAFIENIIMFFPFGFLLPYLHKSVRKVGALILCSFLVSIFIEGTQAVTKRGVFQTDDLMTNVLGGIIGYLIWCLCNYWVMLLKNYFRKRKKN